ncbi:hypothetical protein RHGRI_021147 [Rhododendron griersonianum]|uniref:Uncharacterized protein n=1 Tax=Rhododendron griersonianum TaxID=479676 RepID=A0AAV6JM73_9ERIC|nr:hypothetical protein RHGRI_021147 [Rhododendron griersonianum]
MFRADFSTTKIANGVLWIPEGRQSSRFGPKITMGVIWQIGLSNTKCHKLLGVNYGGGGGSWWSSSELGLVFSFRSFLGSACSQIHSGSHGCMFRAFTAMRALGNLPFLPSSLLTAMWASVILPSPPLSPPFQPSVYTVGLASSA